MLFFVINSFKHVKIGTMRYQNTYAPHKIEIVKGLKKEGEWKLIVTIKIIMITIIGEAVLEVLLTHMKKSRKLQPLAFIVSHVW